VGYNVQVAVDTKHKLIVEQQVTNQVFDMGLLTQTAEAAKEILGVETIEAVADRGYFKIEDIEACEKAGSTPNVPRPQRGPSVKAGLFRKDELSYDADSDSYVCPAGQRLYLYSSSLLRGQKKVNYVNKPACDDCKIRSRCTRGKSAPSLVLRTKRSWTGCGPAWRSAPMSSIAAARRSNIRLGRSSNG
jgi:Transposase DDE domain